MRILISNSTKGDQAHRIYNALCTRYLNSIVINSIKEIVMPPDTNTNEVLLDLDNFNDIDVEGIEAAPEFIEPPTGRYQLGLTAKIEEYEKDDESKKRIRFIYSVQHVEELADKDALVPAEGSLFSETFTVTAEGLRYWKTRSSAILGNLGKSTVGEVINALNGGVSFKADVKFKKTTVKDKDGDKREYGNVNVRVISGDQDPTL